MEFLKSRQLNLVLRLFLGGLFLYAAWDKIAHPQPFAISVRAYQIIPVSMSGLFSLMVSWTEAVAGVMLILGVFTRQAAAAIGLLLVLFTAALALVLVEGLVIDCGCFESGEDASSPVGPLLIVRNIFLLAFAWLVIRYNDGFLSLFPGSRGQTAGPAS